eukprot:TRINITY_DN269_c0_g1_i1.p3 TRINITY_DN269_c0_g1~~TRINITY_DN269_c0_g1_i1.p3  ORF type:complete len:126 (+),score=36.72 TRINITY_DN269_c0_g1_i1:153-530(+)
MKLSLVFILALCVAAVAATVDIYPPPFIPPYKKCYKGWCAPQKIDFKKIYEKTGTINNNYNSNSNSNSNTNNNMGGSSNVNGWISNVHADVESIGPNAMTDQNVEVAVVPGGAHSVGSYKASANM